MAIDQKKKNIVLISVMVVIIAIVLYVFLKDDDATVSVPNIEDSALSTTPAPRIPKAINEEIFKSDSFKRLKDYSEHTYDLEPRGRVNPFEPFIISID